MGEDTIVIHKKTKKPIISEKLCSGCGICVKKCPFDAINIINLPEALGDPVHRYGENMFELFGLPIVTEKEVVGLLGPNGIGKSTILHILSGELKPNLGNYQNPPSWEEIFEFFRGSQLQDYFKKLANKEIRVAHKPQAVDLLPKYVKGNVKDLLEKTDELNKLDEISDLLNLEISLKKDIKELSGGELQRVAIAATLLKDVDFYYFDEPSSWLDIYQRLNMAKVIRRYAEKFKKSILVVEHDLSVLDTISDYIHVLYGEPNAYGVVSNKKSVRVGINEYLKGFLRDENVRFRREELKFHVSRTIETTKKGTIIKYPSFVKCYNGFKLYVDSGELYENEVVTAFGPNSIGKTTFAKILAGVEKPDKGKIEENINIAYKPQYISIEFDGTVEEFLHKNVTYYGTTAFRTEILKPFKLENLLHREVSTLSGGELQRLMIATVLAEDADLYVLDEPTAFLDVEERLSVAKSIRKIVENKHAAAIVIDHDILFLDYIADRAMVFYGKPGVEGHATKPMSLRNAMNKFLSQVNITFRRDKETKRPRANKPDSYLDRKQREVGEYYYYDT